MKRETVRLTKEENRRAVVLDAARCTGRTNKEIAQALGLSVRQVQRLKKALKEEGPTRLAHGNRDREPSNTLSEEVAGRIVELYRTQCTGFNFSHFHDKLVEAEEIDVSERSVRRLLGKAGFVSPRRRRAPKHHSRRERKACEGAMLQLDGSHHDWLEGRGPRLCLLGAIDDATGKVAGAVIAQRGRGGPEQGMGRGMGSPCGLGLGLGLGPTAVSELSLSNDQVAQLQKITNQFMSDTQQLRAQLQTKLSELAKLWTAEEPNESAIRSKIAEVDGIRTRIRNAMVDRTFAVMRVLTSAQKAKLRNLVKTRPGFGVGMGYGLGLGCGMNGGSCYLMGGTSGQGHRGGRDN